MSRPRGGVRRATPATAPVPSSSQASHGSDVLIVPSRRVSRTVAGTVFQTGLRSSQGSTRSTYAARSFSTTHSMGQA